MLAVRIASLPPMWAASVQGTGATLEEDAWRRLNVWAGPRGFLADPERHPIFGFNNPPPSPGKEDYGYELWMRVDGPSDADADVAYKKFDGGLFAVTECRLTGAPDIVRTWRMLWDWSKSNVYHWRNAQELERILNPGAPPEETLVELYLPVTK